MKTQVKYDHVSGVWEEISGHVDRSGDTICLECMPTSYGSDSLYPITPFENFTCVECGKKAKAQQ